MAARSFNDLLVAAGHNSILVVKESTLSNQNVASLDSLRHRSAHAAIFRRIKGRLNEVHRSYSAPRFDDKYCFYNIEESKSHTSIDDILQATGFRPDVIILHWISGFVNAKTIGELAAQTRAQIVWLMMDNAPLTGGCHYPWECTGYQTDCAQCPAILSKSERALAAENLGLKKQYLPSNIQVLACSENDYLRAMSSSLFTERQISKFLIPVDSNLYCPGDVESARRSLGIEKDSRVIFYGSISLNDKRKGGALFLDAVRCLQQLCEPNKLARTVLLIAGRVESNIFADLNIPIKLTGYLDENQLITAYQAADVFVSTSLEDSGPLMINQSIMCGTPVVSFDVGVAFDLVHEGGTGYRARLGDAEDLSRAIARLLDLPKAEYIEMRERCRTRALELCSPHTQTRKLMQILERE